MLRDRKTRGKFRYDTLEEVVRGRGLLQSLPVHLPVRNGDPEMDRLARERERKAAMSHS